MDPTFVSWKGGAVCSTFLHLFMSMVRRIYIYICMYIDNYIETVTRTDSGNIGFWKGGMDTQERMDGEWDTSREC